MSKKYFITSDLHSFYTEFRSALKETGYNKRDKNHVLIICGDIFDRGSQSRELLKFLKSIPKSRRILVRGNHELLFKELLKKSFPDSYDFSNGTVKTFCQLAEMSERPLNTSDYFFEIYLSDNRSNYNKMISYWKEVVSKVKELKIAEWFDSNEWVNYYELDNYIFVHSFIPTVIKKEYERESLLFGYQLSDSCYEYDPNWRSSYNWEEAMWVCPWRKYKDGQFDEETKKGKILVCGHWHTSDFYAGLNNDYTKLYYCPIYYSDHLIGLDACTAITKRVNVLVIEK